MANNSTPSILPDIKPQTEISALDRDSALSREEKFPIADVVAAVGMQATFIRKICGRKHLLSSFDVLQLLDQDNYRETIVPRSKVISYLSKRADTQSSVAPLALKTEYDLIHGNSLDVIRSLAQRSVNCVVTSTPYWGLRIYKDPHFNLWGDGEYCPYGHEQTPEGFLRHTTEVLAALFDVLADDGSIWWNVMDTFNTRTQIRSSAVEALRAMQGQDERSWGDHECRRYSAGHSYLRV